MCTKENQKGEGARGRIEREGDSDYVRRGETNPSACCRGTQETGDSEKRLSEGGENQSGLP